MSAMTPRRALAVLILAVAVGGCATPGQEGRDVRSKYMTQAKKGDVDAQYRVGQSYCCGPGIAYNTDLAIAWLCRAAVQGHREAMFSLADIYAGEIGTGAKLMSVGRSREDAVQAYVWYTAAMIHSHPQAEVRRAEVMRGLKEAELAEARRAATRWTQTRCPPVE